MKFLKKYWRWALAGWIAFVFVQSLFFKFSDSPETRYIFGVLSEWSGQVWFGHYGAYAVGLVELLASVLLFSRWWAWGALLAFEVMCGAILFHLFTPLGIAMPNFDESGQMTGSNDGGLLFIMACLTWLSALFLVTKDWLNEKSQLRSLFRPKHN